MFRPIGNGDGYGSGYGSGHGDGHGDGSGDSYSYSYGYGTTGSIGVVGAKCPSKIEGDK